MSAPRFSSQGYTWEPVGWDTARLAEILEGWRDTPYLSGGFKKRGGADCARFVVAGLDELYGMPGPFPTLAPSDAQFHDPKQALRAVAWIRRRYPCARVRGLVLRPADVVIVGPKLGGMGHVMWVGPRRNTLWDCCRGPGVREGGLSFEAEGQVVKAVYRPELP